LFTLFFIRTTDKKSLGTQRVTYLRALKRAKIHETVKVQAAKEL